MEAKTNLILNLSNTNPVQQNIESFKQALLVIDRTAPSSADTPDGDTRYTSSSAKPDYGFGQPATGSANAGFLFRKIDPERVARYADQVNGFLELSSTFKQSSIQSQLANLNKSIDEQEQEAKAISASSENDSGLASNPTATKMSMKKLGDERVEAVNVFSKHVHIVISEYVSLHRRFILRQHSDASRYMEYWMTMASKSPNSSKKEDHEKIMELLKNHQSSLSEIAQIVRKRLSEETVKDIESALTTIGKSSHLVRLSDHQYNSASKTLTKLSLWVRTQSSRVQRMYSMGSESLIDSITDQETIILYGLKALHLAVAWVALIISSRTFQGYYRQRVYVNNDPPPHPALFVAMFLALDLAAHAVIAVLVNLSKHVWDIDTSVVQAWAIDFTIVTSIVALIAIVMSQLIYSKRYFRYKYEGERGIRALQELVFAVCCVAVPIPMYRLTFG